MIRAVVFDVDGTLYDYDAANAAAIRVLTETACEVLGVSEETFDVLHKAACEEQKVHAGGVCAAIHNRLIRYQLILERQGRPLSHAPKWEQLYWETLLTAMEPTPGLLPCFDWLKQSGYRAGIGTNMTADYQFEKLARLGLLDQLDFVVSSEEANEEKPSARLFQLCVEKAGCAPSECVYVGDNWVHDVEGARAAGLRPVWLHCAPDTPATREGVPCIRDLSELAGACSGLS